MILLYYQLYEKKNYEIKKFELLLLYIKALDYLPIINNYIKKNETNYSVLYSDDWEELKSNILLKKLNFSKDDIIFNSNNYNLNKYNVIIKCNYSD